MPPKYGLQCPQALGTEDVAGKDDDLSAAFGTNSGLVSGSSHLSREGGCGAQPAFGKPNIPSLASMVR